MTHLTLLLCLLATQDVRQASGLKDAVEAKKTPPIEEGAVGIASKYPGDAGIDKDPDVVFAEDFEGTVEAITGRWDQVAGKEIMTKSDDVPPGSAGKHSLLLTRVAGGTGGYLDGGNLYRRLEKGYDRLYFRFYMKFNQEHAPIHHYGASMIGYNPPSRWPQGGAGLRPRGDHSFITQVEPGDFKTWYFYTYWQEMGGSPPKGQTWGNSFELGVPPRPVAREEWICLEVMLQMNDVGDSNGEQCYWLNGKVSRMGDQITGYVGKGFPSSGTWDFDKFYPGVSREGVFWDYAKGERASNAGGKPFPGLRWRNTPDLNINALWLYRYMSQPETGTSKCWWDHLVVAKKYIGPITPGK